MYLYLCGAYATVVLPWPAVPAVSSSSGPWAAVPSTGATGTPEVPFPVLLSPVPDITLAGAVPADPWFSGELSGEMLTRGLSGGATAGSGAVQGAGDVATASRGRCTSTEPSSVE